MTTVAFAQIIPVSNAQFSFGRGVSSYCVENFPPTGQEYQTPSIGASCNLNPAATNLFLWEARESYLTLSNLSLINQIYTSRSNGTTYTFLSEANIDPSIDFISSTFSIETQCSPISTKCNLSADSGAGPSWKCTDAFSASTAGIAGSVTNVTGLNLGLALQYFLDDGLSQPFTPSSSNAVIPWHVGLFAITDSNGQGNYPLYNDSEIVHPVHGGDSFILKCEVSTYDFTYKWHQGIATPDRVRLANSVRRSRAAGLRPMGRAGRLSRLGLRYRPVWLVPKPIVV